MADEKFELTRRKALAGLGTIGAASAGAGLGTTAYLNDTETFSGNSVTAGTLDLSVQATIHEYQGQANGDGQTFTRTVNGQEEDTNVKQELSDVKPGDYSYGKFCFSIVDNPAFVWVSGTLGDNIDNGITEPEDDVATGPGDDDDGTAEGDLADNIQAWLFCVGSGFDPSAVGDRPTNGLPAGAGTVIESGTLKEVLNAISGGTALDADDDDSTGTNGISPFTGTASQSFDDDKCLGFAWELPTTVGNIVQSDIVKFDIDFMAVQERHNDATYNPFQN